MQHNIISNTYFRMVSLFMIIILAIFFGFSFSKDSPTALPQEKPKVAFTFDDGSTSDMPNYRLEEWNQLILDNLEKHKVKAVLFAAGSFLQGAKGDYILSSWNNAGHKIGNHTFTHPNLNSNEISLEKFEGELLKNDSLIRQYSNYYPFFRFPYLKEGNTVEKRDGFRKFLRANGYNIGHVTIDASDWYVNSRLIKRLRDDPDADISGFKQFYIDHIYSRALYYDSLAYQLTERKIPHILLLHHNLTSALFLDDLIQHFKNKGWEIVNADKAYKDEIYDLEPKNIPAGESLIWALAKQTGKYEDVLRYPAEGMKYEKPKMDELGL